MSERSQIRRADGTEPFNSHLWPTESWWLDRDIPKHDFNSRWHFGYVALADGRFAVNGAVYHIRDDEHDGRKNNFTTRAACIRAAAARLIEVMRGSRSWGWQHGGMVGKQLAMAINWVLKTVARETSKKVTRPVTIPEPVVPTGMPLFDLANKKLP